MFSTFSNLKWFIGVVEDNYDKTKLGRVRVRCFNVHPSIESGLVPTEDLPWAIPINGTYNTDYKPPKVGAWVFGFFMDGDDAQHPMLLGTIGTMPTELPRWTPSQDDPDGLAAAHGIINPCELFEPDLPRQARGERIEDTDTAIKYAYRETKIKSADGSEWDQPEPPYNTVYTHNQARVTDSGHVLEVDDTPGAERINFFHRSGTFDEMHPSGNKTQRVTGSHYQVIEKNGYVYVKGAKHVTIEGNCNVYIKNDCNLIVDGDLNQTVHGDYNLSIGGDFNASVRGASKHRAAELQLESFVENIDLFSADDIRAHANSEIHLHSLEDFHVYTEANYHAKADATHNQTSAEQMNLKSSAKIAATGSEIRLNSASTPAAEANAATPAVITELYEPAITKTPVKAAPEDPQDGTYRERYDHRGRKRA